MDWQRDLPYDHIAADLPLSGVPTEADIQQLLRDTEEKLKLNASSIEQSLRDLQGKMGEWAELLEFYRALQQFLKAEENREEVVLQLLVNISYQCGISFPSSVPLGSQQTSLLPSIFCTVRDESPLELQDLWEEVRLQLQLHLLEKLEMVGGGGGGTARAGEEGEEKEEEEEEEDEEEDEEVGVVSRVPKRIVCLQQLLFLYPESQVLARYQRLRAKATRALVQASQVSRAARAAERGFERLAVGFRVAVPALATMVTEDLHALNVVGVEPHATLGFLNQVYLGTVTKELGLLMEREIENALKDNTAPQWKGARRLSRSKATVVPQEPVRKVRSFSLTSHQLGCLSRLASTLLELEQRVEELATDVGFLSCAGESACGPRVYGRLSARGEREPGAFSTRPFFHPRTETSDTLFHWNNRPPSSPIITCSWTNDGRWGEDLKRSKEDLEAGPGEGSSAATPDLLLNSAEPVSLEFEWRGAFVELVPQMAHCVKVLLEDVCARGLQQEEVARASSAVLALGTVPQRQGIGLTCLERECPKMIAKARGLPPGESPGAAGPDTAAGGCNVCAHWTPGSIRPFCGDIMEEVDSLLPLAMVSRGDPLLPVRHSFADVCARVGLALVTRLQERAREVPADAPFYNLPGLLATSIYLGHRLELYESELSDGARTPLAQLPTQKCLDLSTSLQDQLTSYCLGVCASSLLLDAESHYWADPKPFYEDERCSFSIQMWHYFLTGVRSDLWAALPPDLARRLLAQVLCESLQLLVQRYSRARPSYRRVQQVRSDIAAILLCVQQLLWSVCEGLGELLASDAKAFVLPRSSAAADWVQAVHGLCMQLLNVLVVVTTPLPELYGTFRDGPESLGMPPGQAEDAAPAQAEGGASAAPEGEGEDVGTSSAPGEAGTPVEGEQGVTPPAQGEKDSPVLDDAYWLAVINPAVFPEQALRDSMGSDESCLWLLRMVAAGPCFSPSLLLNTLLHRDCLLLRTLMEHSYLFAEEPVDVPREVQEAADGFLEAVVTVLASLSKVPRALTQALEPYLNKNQLWDHFYNLTDSGRPEPAILRCVRGIVSRPTDSLLRQLVHIVQASEDLPGALLQQEPPECLLSKVPKVWNYIPHDAKGKDPMKSNAPPGKAVAMQALSFIFANLPSAVASLPLPVRFLLSGGEKASPTWRCSGHPPCGPAGLGAAGPPVPAPGGQEPWKLTGRPAAGPVAPGSLALSRCLQASVGQQPRTGVPKPAVHMVLQGLEERRPKWISVQLHKARKLCCKSVFERAESEGLQERGGAAFMAAAAAASSPSVSVLPSDGSDLKTHLMVLELSHRAGGSRHLRHIYHIITLNEVALSQWEWAWASLLPAHRTMSQVTFRGLLRNRWEMQEDAELEDEEKALVDHLQKTWFTTSPGPSS
ncbi:hypothetical protein AALO_G00298720 [Alosa alosa]|uniref:Uncharacterized protein n=1 Tax=Alosa alosa TaxID=278164 RepID=A0AAV6FH57_9TELE|nr:hypothetical protein AALO_G00298720 [Alosa alosa]